LTPPRIGTMSMVRLVGFLLAAVAAFLAGTAIVSAQAGDQSDDVVVSGGGTSGVLEPGDVVPVAGPDGDTIVCPDGQRLLVDPLRDNPPRSLTEEVTDANGNTEVLEGAVPRCGPSGGGSDGEPVWVPESKADDFPVEAPQRFSVDGG